MVAKGTERVVSLLPHLRAQGNVALTGLANCTGISSKNTAERFRFNFCSADAQEIIQDANTGCVFIATRHNLHARLVCDGLRAGRAVFVEKPLCLSEGELKEIMPQVLGNAFGRMIAP